MKEYFEELSRLKIWVLWKWIDIKGKPSKKPISVSGGPTGTNDTWSKTWATYDEAAEAMKKVPGSAGIGFVIPKGYFFLDIDHKSYEDPVAAKLLILFNSYSELSISSNGIHIYGKCDIGRLPVGPDGKLDKAYYTKNPHNGIELYIGGLTNRFAVFTGNAIKKCPIRDCTDELLEFLETDMRRKLSEKPASEFDIICSIRAQKNGDKFSLLFDKGDYKACGFSSQSEADLALCQMLAFRLGPDKESIDKLFRKSALYREKWEREDYWNSTIEKAIECCNGVFYESTKPMPEFIYEDKSGAKKVQPAILARCVRDQIPLILVRDNGKQGTMVYIYKDGVYELQSQDMFKGHIKKLITDYDENLLKMSHVNEAYNIIITDLDTLTQDDLNTDEGIINFKNGLLEIYADALVLVPHSKDVLSTIQIPCDWSGRDSPTPVFDSYLDTLTNGNAEIKHLLLEFMGACISNVKGWRMKKALFLVGAGDTGKSQLKALAERLLGKGNYVGIDLKDIEARFGTGVIYGTRLAGSSDMSFLSVDELKTFKKITGGDSLFAELKGQQGFEYTYGGLLWFCMNRLPKFGGDDGQWVYNRIIVVNCPNIIPLEAQDKKLLDKMYEEREGIVYKAVTALKEVIANDYRFSEPSCITAARKEYQSANSSVISFFNECMEESTKVNPYCTTGRIYKVYKAWCNDNNNGYCKSAKDFREELARHLGKSFDEITTKRKGYNYYKNYTLNDEAKNDYAKEYGSDGSEFLL